MDHLIGRYAYKKQGFFSDLIGRIERSESGICPYKLVMKSGTSVGFTKESDIVLVELREDEIN